MAPPVLAVIFLTFASLLHKCVAATLQVEHESIVRRESQAVHLSPHGEITHSGDSKTKHHHRHHHAHHHGHHTRPHTMVKTSSKLSREELATLAAQFCNYDFPLGQDGSNNCTNPTNHSLIEQEAMCVQAAVASGATTSHATFKLSHEWDNKHPKGCFKYQCNEGFGNGVCYYYNPDAVFPQGNLTGTPVCSRKKVLNGTINTNGGCPSGYQLIDDEATCSNTASCLSLASGAEFRIGEQNASKHLDFPRGCFIDSNDGKVYFNPRNALGEGTNVNGMPLCNVSQTVSWASGTTAASGNSTSA